MPFLDFLSTNILPPIRTIFLGFYPPIIKWLLTLLFLSTGHILPIKFSKALSVTVKAIENVEGKQLN